MTEAWLRGPMEGVPPRLMPVAHSLQDSLEELDAAATGLDAKGLWARPGGVASVGFHLRHVCGSLDRLLTYARGESLTEEQLAALRTEAHPGDPPATVDRLLDEVHAAIGSAIGTLRSVPEESLLEPRLVGRAELPSTVQGLLFHAAEHTRRHAGQVIATARIVRADLVPAEEARAGADRAEIVAKAVRAWEDAGIRGLCGEGRFEAVIATIR